MLVSNSGLGPQRFEVTQVKSIIYAVTSIMPLLTAFKPVCLSTNPNVRLVYARRCYQSRDKVQMSEKQLIASN